MSAKNVLVLDPQEEQERTYVAALEEEGYAVTLASTEEIALAQLHSGSADAVVVASEPDERAEATLARVREVNATVPVIFTGSLTTVDRATRLVRLGAFDYLAKPFPAPKLLSMVEGALSGDDQNPLTKAQMELDRGRKRLAKLQDEFKKLLGECKTLTARNSDLEKRVQGSEDGKEAQSEEENEAYRNLEKELKEAREETASRERALEAAFDELARMRTERNDFAEQVKGLEEQAGDGEQEALEARVAETEEKLAEAEALAARVSEVEEKLAEAEARAARVAELEEKLAEAETRAARVAELEEKLAEAEANTETTSHLEEVERELSILRSSSEGVQEKYGSARDRLRELKQGKEDLEGEKAVLKELADDLQEKLKESEAMASALESQAFQLRDELERTQQQVADQMHGGLRQEKEKVEQEAAELMEYLKYIMDNMFCGFLVVDEEETVVALNPQIGSLFKHPLEEIAGKNLAEIPFFAHLRRIFQEYKASPVDEFQEEVGLEPAQGLQIPVLLKILPASYGDKRSYLIVIQDIGEIAEFKAKTEYLSGLEDFGTLAVANMEQVKETLFNIRLTVENLKLIVKQQPDALEMAVRTLKAIDEVVPLLQMLYDGFYAAEEKLE